MLHRFAAIAASALLGLGIAAPVASAGTAPDTKAANIAHRGASAYAPENTLAAVRLGVEMNSDLVEIDVQQTKDDRLVVLHDTTLARTTDVEQKYPERAPWRVRDFTFAEIRTLDAGSWKAPKYAGERIPTLSEVLDLLEHTRSGLLLEVKSPDLYPGIGERIAEELRQRPHWIHPDPTERRLVVQSFDWGFIRDFHGRMPQVKVGVLGAPSTDELDEVATYSDQVNPHYSDATSDYISAVHAHGMTISPYTVNDRDRMRTLLDRGVDGIISNRPDVLDDVMR